jgi:hypothetical protein
MESEHGVWYGYQQYYDINITSKHFGFHSITNLLSE